MKTKELLKQNKDVQEMKNFISWHIKSEDVPPEDFVKKHFKDEEALKKIQKEIESEHGHHVYLCEIVMHLIKYAAKAAENVITADEEIFEDENLQAIDDSDHGCDPGYYESKFDEIEEKE